MKIMQAYIYGNNVRIVIIGILTTIHLLCGCPYFLHNDSGYVSLVHHFFHANIFHLAVNCLSIWTLFRKDCQYKVTPMIWAYVIASASWFFSSADVVGFSNVIFATIGLRTPSLKSSWWKDPSVIVFFVITVLMAFLPQVSAVTHIVSFTLGCMVAGANRIIVNLSRDYRRATYC